jgi:small subunit ribosomal protein S6
MTSQLHHELAQADPAELVAAVKALNGGQVPDDFAIAYAARPSQIIDAENGQPIPFEVLLILDAGIDDAEADSTIEQILRAAREHGALVNNVDVWGRRRLTYPINGHDQGIYVVLSAVGPGAAAAVFDTAAKANRQVLRAKVVRATRAVGAA